MINIIIPVLNEEKILKIRCAYFERLKAKARLVFVDGGSCDDTPEIAATFGEVIKTRPGKALQKNAGAEYVRAGNLLFLNSDCLISEKVLPKIENILGDDCQGGALRMSIADRGKIFRIFEWFVNQQGRKFKIFDADLGLFIEKKVFDSLGGFPEISCMEDILFSLKMRKKVKTEVLPDFIYVSSRKWRQEGFLSTFFRYVFYYIRYRYAAGGISRF